MNEIISSVLLWILVPLCLFCVKLLWTRRWLYYYSWVLPGPLSLPFIGSPAVVFAGEKGPVDVLFKLSERYRSDFRVWIGPQLNIFTINANEAEYLLNNCLPKENILFYQYFGDFLTSIFTTSVHKWQPRRKNLNRSFNQKILNSYFEKQINVAKKMTKELELYCGKSNDLFFSLWTTTIDLISETIGAVNVATLPEENAKFLPLIIRIEELFIERLFNPLYYFDLIWKLSSKYKQVINTKNFSKSQIREIIRRYQIPSAGLCGQSSDQFSKCVLDKTEDYLKNDFIGRVLKGDYNTEELEDEVTLFFVAGSETSAITVGNVFLALSIYPEVQAKLYEEQKTLLNNRELTLEDINKLGYLERVTKETMRLLPPAPFVSRYIDKTVSIDGQVYPEGSAALISIRDIHRNPEYWSNPLKFDPDRFLPEEVAKRPRCAYLPFSVGPRNCIGLKYAMMSTKILLSKIIENFKVLPGHYKSLSEIEMVFHVMQKPRNGYRMLFQKR